MSSMGAPGFQHSMYASQPPLWSAPPSQAMQAPSYGFGPRNMQPGGQLARTAPDYPVPRARMDYGVSRKVTHLWKALLLSNPLCSCCSQKFGSFWGLPDIEEMCKALKIYSVHVSGNVQSSVCISVWSGCQCLALLVCLWMLNSKLESIARGWLMAFKMCRPWEKQSLMCLGELTKTMMIPLKTRATWEWTLDDELLVVRWRQ